MDFAVVAKFVGIDGQVVFGPVVSVYGIEVCVSELAAYIGWFYPRPAGTAGFMIYVGWIFYTVQAGGDEA